MRLSDPLMRTSWTGAGFPAVEIEPNELFECRPSTMVAFDDPGRNARDGAPGLYRSRHDGTRPDDCASAYSNSIENAGTGSDPGVVVDADAFGRQTGAAEGNA
jgi:hypothetical protein